MEHYAESEPKEESDGNDEVEFAAPNGLEDQGVLYMFPCSFP